MQQDQPNLNNFPDLHWRAEKAVRGQLVDVSKLSSDDIQHLFNELQVHQIELEMQNEKLRQAQQQLEESHDKYVDLYDFAPIGYFTVSETGLILEANLTVAGLLGVGRDVLLKQPLPRFIARADEDVFYLHRKQVMETQACQTCELKMVQEGGTPFDARLESIATQGDEGDYSRFRVAVVDITQYKQMEDELRRHHDHLGELVQERTAEFTNTNERLQQEIVERKQAEKALHQSKQRYKRLLESVTDYIYTVKVEDSRPVATALGPGCEAVTGYTLEEYEADPHLWHQMIHETDRPAVTEQAVRLLAGETIPPLEHRIIHKSGHSRWVRNTPVPRYDNQGRLVTYDGLISDITERKQAETDLRIKDYAIASSINAIGITDLEGKMIYVNDSLVKMWGYDSKDDILGRLLPEFWEGEGVLKTIKALREQGGRVGEDVGKRKDGSLFDVEFSANMIKDEAGNPLSMFGSFLDITERKQAEESVRQSRTRLQLLNGISSRIIARMPVEQIIEDTIKQLSLDEHFSVLRVAYSTIDDRGKITILQAIEPPDMPKLIGLEADLNVAPDYLSALQQGDAVIVKDISQDTRLAPLAEAMSVGETRAILDVPVIRSEKGVDLLCFDAPQPRQWSEHEIVTLTSVAKYLSIAINKARIRAERQRAEDEAEQRVTQLALLHQLDQAITASLDINDVYHAFARHAVGLLPYDRLSIALVQESQTARIVYTYGGEEGLPPVGDLLPLKSSVTGWVIKQGRPLLLQDNAVANVPFGSEVQLTATEIQSSIIIPLRIKKQVIGTWNIGSRQMGAYQPDDLKIAQLMADQLAITIENARLFEQVRIGHKQLRSLSHRLVEVQENERRHIARELHDEIGQVLTGLKLLLEMSVDLPPDSLEPALKQAVELTDDLMTRVQELSLNLRPTVLDDLGLLRALAWHFNRYTNQTGIHVDFKYLGSERQLTSAVETAAYRIIQESLTNIARYADVNEASVHLWLAQDMLCLLIQDEGIGFDPEAVLTSGTASGLLGMQERAILLGGQLTIESTPEAGTCLTAELPLSGEYDNLKSKMFH